MLEAVTTPELLMLSPLVAAPVDEAARPYCVPVALTVPRFWTVATPPLACNPAVPFDSVTVPSDSLVIWLRPVGSAAAEIPTALLVTVPWLSTNALPVPSAIAASPLAVPEALIFEPLNAVISASLLVLPVT